MPVITGSTTQAAPKHGRTRPNLEMIVMVIDQLLRNVPHHEQHLRSHRCLHPTYRPAGDRLVTNQTPLLTAAPEHDFLWGVGGRKAR